MGERSASPELFLIFVICSVPLQISLKNVEFFIKIIIKSQSMKFPKCYGRKTSFAP